MTPATRDGLVAYGVIVWFWVLENDVPCVDETGDKSETAEREVDD